MMLINEIKGGPEGVIIEVEGMHIHKETHLKLLIKVKLTYKLKIMKSVISSP